jgi:DNA-binding transcriptional MerR regulator/methylmalonyl-CoA mutase cobalamin-binding subunit
MRRQRQLHQAYPVRTVARLTGLSPDLIRAWEKRYAVVSPVRGPRGARLYSADDIQHLRLLGQVVSSGRAIGDVAGLSMRELAELAVPVLVPAPEPIVAAPDDARVVEELLGAIERFDGRKLEEQLGAAVLAFGDRHFVRRVAVPLLTLIGQRWEKGRLPVAAEHLTSSAVRNLIGGLLRNRGPSDHPTVLLATPSGERHEFGILLIALLLRTGGVGVHYLGPDLPSAEILGAAAQIEPVAVGLGLVDQGNAARARSEVRAIEAGLNAGTELWLGGRAAADLYDVIAPTRAQVFSDLDAVEIAIERLRTIPAPGH